MTDALGFVRFSAVLEVKTDLHIGDGGEVERDSEAGRMATVVRDVHDNPVIPGTALKGVLRAAVTAQHGAAEADRLFGAIKTTAGSSASPGHAGRITLYAARQCEAAKPSDLPKSGKEGTAMATHVAIGRKRGVAEAQKLFNREIVPAGATFRLEGMARGVDGAEDDLKKALAPLRACALLGRGTGKGNGRMRLKEGEVRIVTRRLDVSDSEPKVVESPGKLEIAEAGTPEPARQVCFKLHCPGPFLSHDPDRNDRVKDQANVLFALRRACDRPVLWRESLYGVLRERCAWLAATDNAGDGCRDGEERFTPLPADKSASTLGRTGRLFGVPGWRGLVRIGAFDLSGGTRLRNGDMDRNGGMAGISIDRFSGAVLDTGPFFADAWIGLTLKFSLILETRGGYPSKEDSKLFDVLVQHIRSDGLLLGHGVNRGFGWFDDKDRIQEVSL